MYVCWFTRNVLDTHLSPRHTHTYTHTHNRATHCHVQIPINETVLLHRHGVALVTAPLTVRSIADIDWLDLVLHLWPSGTAAAQTAQETHVTLFHDATSRAPAVWTTPVTVGPGNGTGACDTDLLASASRRWRTVHILIGRESETVRGNWPNHRNIRTSTARRAWTLRVHLAPGEQLERAVVDNVQARPSVTRSAHHGSALLAPDHGTAAELYLKPSTEARVVALCISG